MSTPTSGDAADARRVLEGAELLHTSAEVQAAYDRLANDIQDALADASPVVLAVMIGGLIPTAELLARLAMPLELDYVHATRYRGETSGREIEWRVRPAGSLRDRHVLVVDDILDEGHTLKAILDAVQRAGVASLRCAVLVEKLHHRRAGGLVADFVGLQVPDRYVFGCGMDYRGWFRQLPAIYAVGDHGRG